MRDQAAHEIAAGIGSEKARALPMVHTLTGCDTVSSFAGLGNKTAWAIWTLLKLSAAPLDTPEDIKHIVERFVVLLYDRYMHGNLQNSSYSRTVCNLIPPSKAALEDHVKRAAYQGGHVWDNANN